jgi:hypothetical protein
MTPKDLAAELGISDRTLRAWLRTEFRKHHVRYERWELDAYQIAEAYLRWGMK